jgi:hypothetical protein
MPDFSYSINGQVSKGSLSQSFSAGGITASMATAGVMALTMNLGTNAFAVSTANMGALGFAIMRSLATSATHTVSFGRYVGGTLHETVSLRAGEAAIMRLAAGDYAAKSAVENTRAVITIYED